MKNCPACNAPVEDDAIFCPNCGTNISAAQNAASQQSQGNPYQGGMNPPPYQAPPVQPYYDPYDHTAEFSAKDISDNKVIAMLVYLLGPMGIIIALLAAKDSPFAAFHVRQALKFTVVEILLGIIAVLLCWTIIVPIAAGVCYIILFVLQIICFFQICSGKAKEPAIIRGLGFLR